MQVADIALKHTRDRLVSKTFQSNTTKRKGGTFGQIRTVGRPVNIRDGHIESILHGEQWHR